MKRFALAAIVLLSLSACTGTKYVYHEEAYVEHPMTSAPETVSSDTPEEAEQRARVQRMVQQQDEAWFAARDKRWKELQEQSRQSREAQRAEREQRSLDAETALEAARINAAGMAAMGFFQSGGLRLPQPSPPPAPIYQAPAYEPIQRPQRCMYDRIGNQVYQNCY